MNKLDFDRQTYHELEWVWKLKHITADEWDLLEIAVVKYLGPIKTVNLRGPINFIAYIKFVEYVKWSVDYIINDVKGKSVKFVHLAVLKKFNDNPNDALKFIKQHFKVRNERFKRAKLYINRWRNKRFSYNIVFEVNDPVVKKVERYLKDPNYHDLTPIELESFLGGTVPLRLYSMGHTLK